MTVATGMSQSASTPVAQIRDARKHILADTARALEKAGSVNVPVPSSLTCVRMNLYCLYVCMCVCICARKHTLADTARALEKVGRVNVPVPSSLTCVRMN